MNQFHGFPKANPGHIPACAKRFKVCVIWAEPMSDGRFSSMTPFNANDAAEWRDDWMNYPSAIAAYIETSIPL